MSSTSFSSLYCNGLTLRSDSSVIRSRPLGLSGDYINLYSRHTGFIKLQATSYSKVDYCLLFIYISIVTLSLIMYSVMVLNYFGLESIMDNVLCNIIESLCAVFILFLIWTYALIVMCSDVKYSFILPFEFKIYIHSLFICIINNWVFSLYIMIIVLFRIYMYFDFYCFMTATSNMDITILLTNGEIDNTSETGASSSGGGTSSSGGGNGPVGPDNPQPSNSSSSINFSESNRNSNSESNTNQGYESDDSSTTMTQETYIQALQQEQLYEDTVEAILEHAQEYLEAYKNLSDQEKQEVEQLVRDFVYNLSDMIEEE